MLRAQRKQQAAEKLRAGNQWRDSGLVFATELGTPVEPFSNRETLYKAVLLACARCPTDEVGSFGAPDVREQLRAITGINYDIPAFAAHLKDFSSEGPRGGVLKRIGTTRRFRYQFRDPLMPTYVLVRGRLDGLDQPGPEAITDNRTADVIAT